MDDALSRAHADVRGRGDDAAPRRPGHRLQRGGPQAILGDPHFAGGDYYGGEEPQHGLSIARMVGHITYLSDESMRAKFGRRLRHREDHAFDFVTEFEVESYLAHQGRKFVERFDANTYLYMTKSMDYFDLAAGHDSVAEALAGTPVRFLLLTFSSDWLFPTYQTKGSSTRSAALAARSASPRSPARTATTRSCSSPRSSAATSSRS